MLNSRIFLAQTILLQKFIFAENARRSLLNFDTFDTYDDLETFREEIDTDEISLENDFLLNESKNIIVDYLKFSSQLIAVNQN